MPSAQSTELIDKGIDAARSGNRLLARMHLEKSAEIHADRADLWMWLAWAAESPVKAQVYLNKLQEFASHRGVAEAGLMWIRTLTNTNDIPAPQPRNDFKVACPACSTILVIRPTAIGETRPCPACKTQLQIERGTDGIVGCRRLETVSNDFARKSYLPMTSREENGGVKTSIPRQLPVISADRVPTILVIDDNATIRRIASLVLTRKGYHVLTATTGEEGLELAKRERPHLVLLDVALPGVSGYEICKRLRADAEISATPVVMLSGKDDFFDMVKGYEAGSSTYLTKPCSASEMIATVQKFVPIQPVPADSSPRSPVGNPGGVGA